MIVIKPKLNIFEIISFSLKIAKTKLETSSLKNFEKIRVREFLKNKPGLLTKVH